MLILLFLNTQWMNKLWWAKNGKWAPFKSRLTAQSPGIWRLGATRTQARLGSESHQAPKEVSETHLRAPQVPQITRHTNKVDPMPGLTRPRGRFQSQPRASWGLSRRQTTYPELLKIPNSTTILEVYSRQSTQTNWISDPRLKKPSKQVRND